ncbi:MAG TPA: radical SAM/SPASM domain-containing protein [Phycisphaerae bacterium]|nr:radical SAM/SPASM domain-containing protein [Phycisphaerae bacterium]
MLLRDPLAREAWWNNFLKELSYTHAQVRSLGRPQVFEIETTNRCPFACVMCPRTYAMTRPVGDMDIGLFRELIDQMHPAWQMDKPGGRPLVRLLHYGEPFVYRHFAESIQHCHRRGFQVLLSSNPAVWTEHRIQQALDTGVDEIMAMVDGMDDETSTAIRGSAAGYARAEANIRRLAELKVKRGSRSPYLVLAMIKQPRNAHQWELFTHYWKGIEGIDGTYLAHYSVFDGSIRDINRINDTLMKRDSSQAEQYARQLRLSRFPCYYPWHSVAVTWSGEVVPCCRDYNCTLVLGDLNRQSLHQIWNGSLIRHLRRAFIRGRRDNNLCRHCVEASLEIGLPGRHYAPASFLRRRGYGKMHQMGSSPGIDERSWSTPQNLSGGGYKRQAIPARQEEEEPVAV